MPLGTIEIREGFGPLELFEGFSTVWGPMGKTQFFPWAHSLSKKILTSWWTGEQAPPPLPPLPVFAEIFQISGRKNCKETISALENEIFRRKNRPVPAVHAAVDY